MMPSSARDPSFVPEIGKYHLVAELARGGMGNVYLAVAQGPGGFNKLLVVKELKPELSDDETYVAMFREEARLAARLHHPNIVQTNEVGSDGQRHFMVMEFLDGRSLHRICKRLGAAFPVGAHLRVIADALLGLHHAHELREFDGAPLDIVHRDVSPLNVFVTFAGQAKVLDFGIAKATDSSLETKMGVLKGRVAYMSPEQAKGAKVDRRADVYSAGVMLWEAAAGRRLWPGMSEVEILTQLLREGAPRLRAVRPDAPEDLEMICARAMAWNREDRYPTAGDLLYELEEHLARREDRASMRDVGATIAEAFADERKKMNALIEETLARVRSGPRSGVMPALSTPLVGLGGPPSSGRIEAPMSLRFPTPSTSFSAPGASSLGSLSRSAPATSATLSAAQSPDVAPSWPASLVSVRKAVLVGAGALGILVGAALLGASLRGKAEAERAGGASPAEVSALSSGAAAAGRGDPDLVEVAIHVSPAAAQITIDGASVVTNPFRARYPKDGQIHHITAAADGYDAKLEDISFASDVSIDISLNRHVTLPAPRPAPPPPVPAPLIQMHPVRHVPAGPPASAAAQPETPPAPPPTRVDVGPQGGRTPLRPISTSNPYGNP
ncbi:MAG: serine/threonine protein kinase [Myxococcales bacterium]|nr:serine/threonine protein kinase [Myxococcales bacterium]